MSKSVRKVFVTAVIAAVAMSVAAPAHAQTVAELNALIASLQAQINQLLAQISGLGGSTGGGVTGIPAGFTFSQNLAQGASSQDVMYLQKALNAYNNSPIASSGAGSRGSETQFFGPITRSGVVAFQNKYASEVLIPVGLTSGTGFVGPSTRAKLNSLLGSFPIAPGTPPPGVIGTPGLEGSVIVTMNSNPASGAILNTSEVEAVTAVNVKATGSDVLVSRLDLEFNTRPWLYIAELTVSDGTTSKTIAVTEGNSTELTVGSLYSVRVSGLSILVPKDTTKVFTVTVKAASALPVGTTSNTNIQLTFNANSVRGTDGAGLTQTGPTVTLGAVRTITVQEPSSATLEITANPANPEEQAVIVNTTAETAGIVLAVIDVKSKNNDTILRTVKFTDTDDASGTINVAYLYDGNTLLSSTSSLAAGTSTFSNVDLTIPKDTTKTLTIKADIKKTTGNYEEGATSTIVVRATVHGFAGEDADTFGTATVTGSNVAPGSAHYYTKAPKVVLASKSITAVESGTASSTPQALNGAYTLDITALGGDIYIPISTANSVASSGILVATSSALATTLVATFDSNADFGDSSNDTYVVRSGTTKSFNVTGNIAACPLSGAGLFIGLATTDIKWGTTVSAAQQPANTWTWNLTDFKSGESFLPACS